MPLRVETEDQWWLVEGIGARNGHTHVAKVAPGVKAVAYANHGRWVVDCPFNCGSARMAHPKLNFWCSECGNSEVGGLEVKIVWPKDAAAIEALLGKRQLERNRNAYPHETPQMLDDENKAFGVR